MDAQRLRNLTTGRLHTSMDDIYEDIEFLVGEQGLMTHQIPAAFRALLPWLKERVTDARFWDETYDPTHTGDVDIQPMTDAELKQFRMRYELQPSPFTRFRELVAKE